MVTAWNDGGVEMKSLFAMIGKVLRAMKRAAVQWREVMLEVGGKMVRMLIPSGPPIEVDEPEPAEVDEDQFNNNLRELARQLLADGTPDPDRLAALPTGLARWLTVLDDGQLRSVMRSSDDELQAHFRGRKGLRGVPWADKDSVDEWVAGQTGRDVSDPELETELAWRLA